MLEFLRDNYGFIDGLNVPSAIFLFAHCLHIFGAIGHCFVPDSEQWADGRMGIFVRYLAGAGLTILACSLFSEITFGEALVFCIITLALLAVLGLAIMLCVCVIGDIVAAIQYMIEETSLVEIVSFLIACFAMPFCKLFSIFKHKKEDASESEAKTKTK